jgi:Ca-activated chloride channel family protein
MSPLFLFIFSFSGHATNLSAISPNNQGLRLLSKENQYGAYQKFIEAAAEDSFDPTIRLNLGVTYLMNKEPDKALGEFKMAETLATDNETKFQARFNQAVTLAGKKDIPGALHAYQSALELKPDSQEVKTNIELLWQQQQGQGEGEGDPQKDQNKDGKGDGSEDQKKDQAQGGGEQKDQQPKKQQPKPFESKELTPDTVRKVLEELKSQEQRVRAEHYTKGAKERPRDKQW